jgi:hypothetical protein
MDEADIQKLIGIKCISGAEGLFKVVTDSRVQQFLCRFFKLIHFFAFMQLFDGFEISIKFCYFWYIFGTFIAFLDFFISY